MNRIRQWLKANKFSLNIKKTKNTLFHQSLVKSDIPLKLPKLKSGIQIIERKSFLKFFGVMLENSWRTHIRTLENII